MTSLFDGPTLYQMRSVNVVGATTATQIALPQGAFIQHIFVHETSNRAITGGLKFGTTNGGTDIISSIAVSGNSKVHATDSAIATRGFLPGSQTVYIDAAGSWNSAKADIFIIYCVPVA